MNNAVEMEYAEPVQEEIEEEVEELEDIEEVEGWRHLHIICIHHMG